VLQTKGEVFYTPEGEREELSMFPRMPDMDPVDTTRRSLSERNYEALRDKPLRTPETNAKAHQRQEMLKLSSQLINRAVVIAATATEAAVAASQPEIKQAQKDVAETKKQVTKAYVSVATSVVAKAVDAAQRSGYSADTSMVSRLRSVAVRVYTSSR
jgi:hypothetical protein